MRSRSWFYGVAILVLMALGGACAPKAAFPEKPINLVVGTAAGSSADLLARALAEAAKPHIPQPVAVVNRPGAAQATAAGEVFSTKADGYTGLLIGSAAITLLPHLQPNMPYKGPGDFTSVVGLVDGPSAMAVSAESPWKTAKEFADAAKANPGKLRVGTLMQIYPHANAEIVNEGSGRSMVIVPLETDADGVTKVLGGHIEAAFGATSMFIPQVKAGKMRLLGVAYGKRVDPVSDVPTLKEQGFTDAVFVARMVVIAPKGTPDSTVEVLYNGFKKASEADAFKSYAAQNVYIPAHLSSADLKKTLDEDYKINGAAAKKLNWTK